MERKHGKTKRYVKLHFAVDVETKEVVSMEGSTDDVHDVKAFPGLVKEAKEKRRIACWLGDGVYDTWMVFKALEARGIEAVIKPRRNSVPDTASPARSSLHRTPLWGSQSMPLNTAALLIAVPHHRIGPSFSGLHRTLLLASSGLPHL